MIRIIFVCMGNICRSPMAEGVFADLLAQNNLQHQFEIDSAGTDAYHVGQMAHSGTRAVLAKHHIRYDGRARLFKQTDFERYDYIVAMDDGNIYDIKRLDRNNRYQHKIYRLLDFAKKTSVREVPDPYYTNNFDYVYELVLDGCQGLLAHIQMEQLR